MPSHLNSSRSRSTESAHERPRISSKGGTLHNTPMGGPLVNSGHSDILFFIPPPGTWQTHVHAAASRCYPNESLNTGYPTTWLSIAILQGSCTFARSVW